MSKMDVRAIIAAGVASAAAIGAAVAWMTAPSKSEMEAEWERERAHMEAARRRAERQAGDLRERMRVQGENRAALERQVREAEEQLAEIQREEEARNAALEARREQERARLDRIGMDNVHNYNFGIVGNAGAGKSTLVNCVRAVRASDPTYAPTAVGHSGTIITGKYPHPSIPHMVFWDIPGGGEYDHPAATYWEDQCLDLFDCLIVVINTRFSEVAKYVCDKALEQHRPFIIVHSKSLFSITNSMEEREMTREDAEAGLRAEVRHAVNENLGPAGEHVRVLLIDSHALRRGRPELDEVEMMEFMVGCTAARSPEGNTAQEAIERFREARSRGATAAHNNAPEGGGST